ncbi:hypothetical protein ANCCEY_13168 [Ancylostoma ceylanicum]|uniref:Meckelin n=1 Tax=Ancylostoma ceylanicum TaxID=53326 RepID=A0A0D6LD13_9BILA|nr:hypothetical protein ANCCEY_13168 [Ancylostoma ceylanicum]
MTILPAIFITTVVQFSYAQYAQTLAVPFQTESNCTETQYFNARTLSCQQCADGTVPKASKRGCQCPAGSIIQTITPKSITCQKCPEGLYSSPSGLECIPCPSPPCCPAGSIYKNLVDQSASPTSSTVDRTQCVACKKGTVPNAEGTACQPCATLECYCKVPQLLNLFTMTPSLCTSTPLAEYLDTNIRLSTGVAVKSALLEKLLDGVSSRCTAGSEQDCQVLANLCVLQNYESSTGTACDIIEKLRLRRAENMAPLLFFSNDADTELYRETAIPQQFMFDSGFAGHLDITLVRYALNGTFLGMIQAEKVLQPCAPEEAAHLFEFGRKYSLDCSTSLDGVIFNKEATFFEAYLKYFDEKGNPQLYPIPILNNMIRSQSGTYLNQLGREANRWVLTRRFYLSDDYSLPAVNSTQILRYARNLHLHVELQPTRDGLIFPPYLWIDYAEVNSTQTDVVGTRLSVTYEIEPTRHDRELEISMAVLGPLSVIWAVMKAYSWGRRSGKASLLDASTVLQFLLYQCAALGDVFFIVVTAMSCWITFAYKSQKYPFYTTLNEDQEWVLMAYLIATLCLKFVALLHTILQMVLQETFFIDWERPQLLENSQTARPPSRDVSKDRVELPVVVWRTYLVANEWAELRCVRATCIGLQLLLVLMFLEAFNFMRFSIVQPGFGYGSMSTGSTIMTRFAVVVFFYLVIGFLQWIVQVVVVERMILDPFHNFIDLCSIANISVLSLTHPLHGHYIHGRSVHGRADTGMAEMNEFLQKERDDLCGFRGLEPTSHLQTFTVCLPTAFRTRYDEIMTTARNAITQTRLTGLDQTTAKMAATVRAHQQMNTFLREMIDHSVTDVDYVIRDRSFAEALLDAELTDTSQTGNFLRNK